MLLLKPSLLFIILSIHRKEAHSSVLTSDETSVTCGPGCFKSCEDQEVRLSGRVFAYGFISLPFLNTQDILFRGFLPTVPPFYVNR